MSRHVALRPSSRPPLNQQQLHVDAPLHCDQSELRHQRPAQAAGHVQVPALLRLRQRIGEFTSIPAVSVGIFRWVLKRCAFPLQGLTDIEADLSSMGSRLASLQVSCDISRDTAELPEFKISSSFKSKMKSHDSGIFERVLCQISLPYFLW